MASSVLPAAAAPAAAQNNSGSPYLNNAERVFEYTIDYEVGWMPLCMYGNWRGRSILDP